MRNANALVPAPIFSAIACVLLCPLTECEAALAETQVIRERFATGLAPGWSIEREDRSAWRTGPSGLEVRVQPGNMWGGANNARNVFVRPIPSPAEAPIEISVTLSNRPSAQWEQANLVWYYDAGSMVKLGQELVTGRYSIVMGREENDRARTIAIVPLDANAVELRLQAYQGQVRGQFRTSPWKEWRDVGACDLPVKGEPKASLQFYNGPADLEHWVRVTDFAVRKLPRASLKWPWPPAPLAERVVHAGETAQLVLSSRWRLTSDLTHLRPGPSVICEHQLFQYKDGTSAWHWNRRNTSSKEATFAGVELGGETVGTSPQPSPFDPVQVGQIDSFEAELDVVTWLENDEGDHNLALFLAFQPAGSLSVWFDWYGPAVEASSVDDGYRHYSLTNSPAHPGEFQYRITGFRGAPPRVNLKALLQHATQHGLSSEAQIRAIRFGNQVWDGSRGGTRVTRVNVRLNGRSYSMPPSQGNVAN